MAENNNSRAQVIEELRHKLEVLESAFRSSSAGRDDITPTGIEALNQILPKGGFPQGTLTEWLAGGEGTGGVTLAMQAALPWLSDGRTCMIIDESQEFYPAALAALGIDLEQMLIVRPAAKDMLWALEQALLCRGVAVTVAWLGPAPERILRRLQLAAESGGGLGVLFRSVEVRTQPIWAHVRFLVTALPGAQLETGRRTRIEMLYCRGGQSGSVVEVDIDDETSHVRVVPPLAPARDARQAT